LLWAYLHHLCAGIRFLFLDIHKGIDLPTARVTSVIVLAASIALTAVLGGMLLW
jgi:succinate dehydrogenase / fumarate reductase cytochrome b subunit